MIILKKDHSDEEVINSALQKISENESKELKIHFIYAGYYHYWDDKLRSIILNGMKKHKIKSVMVTRIDLERSHLITKEEMESYCKGEEDEKDSVNDDLESLFENIRLGKEPVYDFDEQVYTYFLPKLTEEELELVERRDLTYFQTFFDWVIEKENPDVDETEMMLSESDSKYVKGWSSRRTFVIKNLPDRSSETTTENSSSRRRFLIAGSDDSSDKFFITNVFRWDNPRTYFESDSESIISVSSTSGFLAKNPS